MASSSTDPNISTTQRLRNALAQLAQRQVSGAAIGTPTASELCELAGVSRNALYRYHPDVLHELHNLQHRQRCAPGPAKRVLQQLRDENQELRRQMATIAALVDHYFGAWQESRALLTRRERELAELRRRLKAKVVAVR